MTTHYLLLSDPLVPAALDGRKTQTRRVISWSNSLVDGAISKYWRLNWQYLDFSRAWLDKGPSPAGNPGPYLHVPVDPDFGDTTHRIYPRYTPEDRLIFKETWMPETEEGVPTGGFIYRATDHPSPDGDRPLRWRSSMLMPTAAARSINRITDVRCLRLQEITEEDARAEGAPEICEGCGNPPEHEAHWVCEQDDDPEISHRVGFRRLWDSLNAKRGFPYDSNPRTWALTFERIKEAS